MAKEKQRMEYRYYDMPPGEYVLPKLGKGWEQEYGIGYEGMLHFHNYMEIGYCYHGDGTLVIQDREVRYQGDMFTVIPENLPHTTVSAPGNICKWEYLFIDTRNFLSDVIKVSGIDEYIIRNALDRSALVSRCADQPELSALVRAMLEECRRGDRYKNEILQGYLYAFLMLLVRHYSDVPRSEKNNSGNSYLNDAIHFIYKNYREGIQISDVARACGLSESHFRRVFEESMNMKPVDFLNMVRIRAACRMIEREDYSMRDICFRVGYETPSTFNRNFRRLTGMTPYEWKKKKGNTAEFFRNFRISARKGWEAKSE